MIRFDFTIGNPPYQGTPSGDQKTFAPPVYHKFVDAAHQVSNRVVIICPARFLSNAGSTPKAWNRKMLEDPHLEITFYDPDGSGVFPGMDIKGGVVILYRDTDAVPGPIRVFTPFPELRGILEKVLATDFKPFSDIVYTRTAYRLTDKLHEDYPEAASRLSKGHLYDMATNIFQSLPWIFHDDRPDDGRPYLQIYGREGTRRVFKWVYAGYVNDVANTDAFKIFVPKANGSGTIGEALSNPVVSPPGTGHTESFISIGSFATREEADACLKYVKSRFARVLLGVLKSTQDNPPDRWQYVPLQDFTDQSDIDWTGSPDDVDLQLYRKYGLNTDEMVFIESHGKRMP